MRTLAIALIAAAAAGCAAARPPALPPPPQMVATPVYACPVPPAIAAPEEPVYDLRAEDAAGNPDKVMKSAAASIGNLEAALDQCTGALEVYRK